MTDGSDMFWHTIMFTKVTNPCDPICLAQIRICYGGSPFRPDGCGGDCIGDMAGEPNRPNVLVLDGGFLYLVANGVHGYRLPAWWNSFSEQPCLGYIYIYIIFFTIIIHTNHIVLHVYSYAYRIPIHIYIYIIYTHNILYVYIYICVSMVYGYYMYNYVYIIIVIYIFILYNVLYSMYLLNLTINKYINKKI